MRWKNIGPFRPGRPSRVPALAVALPLSALLWSCATTPVPVDIPPDHPAHPDAAESPFSPPPNPFAEAEPVPGEATEPPPMEHGHGHHGSHGTAPPPAPEPPSAPEQSEEHGHGHHPTEPPPGGSS